MVERRHQGHRPQAGAGVAAIDRERSTAGTLSAATAKSLGLSTDTVVSAGGGDNMMGAIGTGNTRPGIVTASFGTSGTIMPARENL